MLRKSLNLLIVLGLLAVQSAMKPSRVSAQEQSIDPNLVVYWKMEEGTGTTVVDSAGNGHDLFLTSSPATPQWSTTDVPPLTGGNTSSLAFDGNGYAYAYPIPETAGSSHLTVEAWIKFDSPVPYFRGIITANEPQQNGQWSLTTADPNVSPLPNELEFWVGGYGPAGVTVGANLQPGQWYHIASVYDGTGATNADRLKIYINGIAYPLSFYNGMFGSALANTLPPLRVGRY